MMSVLVGYGILLAHSAFAGEEKDVLVMKNGDRITGKVKGLDNGVLRFDVDYADGTISIDWRKVLRIDSKTLFIVRLKDSSLHVGKLGSPKQSIIAVSQISEDHHPPLVVDNSEVVRVVPTSESLMDRFSGSITTGTQYSKGNSTTQYSIGSELDYRESNWGAGGSYAGNLSASTGANTSTRNEVNLIVYRVFWRDYFYQGSSGFLQSSVQGIQRQTSLGIGIGRFLKDTNRVRFAVTGGLGWQGTHYVPLAQTQQSQNLAVGLLLANLDVFSFKSTRLDVRGSFAPSLTEAGRNFAKMNASYFIKVLGKIDWNFSFYGNWDTRPPTHLQSSDYGTTTGLSYTFGNK